MQRSSGKVLYCSSDCPRRVQAQAPRAQRVADSAHIDEITSVLSDNSARCTLAVCEFGLNSPLHLDRPAAAKTGTTNAWTDNWTVGYTPQIVRGVWVGNADGSPMLNVTGITGAAPIWHDFMEGTFRILRLPIARFATPAGVKVVSQCAVSGTQSWHTTASDVYMPGTATPRPLCAIPERGTNPALCTSSLHPAGQACIYGGYPGGANPRSVRSGLATSPVVTSPLPSRSFFSRPFGGQPPPGQP